jgi:uncharacterized protein
MRAMMALGVALAVGGGVAGAAALPADDSAMVPMTVRAVGMLRGQSVVLLEDGARKVVVPIWIGPLEANAIDMRLQGQKPPRPLTHDLLERTLTALGAKVERVEVIELRDGVFIARLTLRDGKGGAHAIDARASDSIALALGAGLPVWVAPKVLREAGMDAPPAP